MNLDIVNLVKLQRLDEQIEKLNSAEKEGAAKIARIEAEQKAAEEAYSDSQEREQSLQKRKRELERSIEEAREKIKNNQGRQLQVKTNEEYRALLKEQEYLKKSQSEKEDELLEVMQNLEDVSAENEKTKAWLEEQRGVWAENSKEVQAWVDESLKDREKFNIERAGLTRDIPRDFLSLYTRVYPNRNGKAVVGIVDGICQECHLQIPPQSYNELQRNESLMTCPNCQRIIFWRDHQDFEDIC